MRDVDVFLLVAAGGAWMDLSQGRIDNGFVLCSLMAGFLCRLVRYGPESLPASLAGAVLPLLLLGWLFALRVLGAGDIKLLMALGSFLGPGPCLDCLWGSLICGAALSLLMLCRSGELVSRMSHALGYLGGCLKTGTIVPYRPLESPGEGTIPFALAILGGAIYAAGGLC